MLSPGKCLGVLRSSSPLQPSQVDKTGNLHGEILAGDSQKYLQVLSRQAFGPEITRVNLIPEWCTLL